MQAEIIRKVLFELGDFAAYQLYTEIKNGMKVYETTKHELGNDGNMQEYAPSSNRIETNGICHKAFYCYFQVKLNPGTLKCELTEKQCSFLVNLMTDNNHSVVSYEQFLDFIIPRTKKKISKALINKIKQTSKALHNG